MQELDNSKVQGIARMTSSVRNWMNDKNLRNGAYAENVRNRINNKNVRSWMNVKKCKKLDECLKK